MADYGTDVSTVTSAGVLDLDPYFTLVSGQTAMAHAIARRLSTPLGGLIDDPDYGFDLTALVNVPTDERTLFEARSECEAQCLLDERVNDATVTMDAEDGAPTVSVALELSDGVTFTLVLAVSAVTVEILEGA